MRLNNCCSFAFGVDLCCASCSCSRYTEPYSSVELELERAAQSQRRLSRISSADSRARVEAQASEGDSQPDSDTDVGCNQRLRWEAERDLSHAALAARPAGATRRVERRSSSATRQAEIGSCAWSRYRGITAPSRRDEGAVSTRRAGGVDETATVPRLCGSYPYLLGCGLHNCCMLEIESELPYRVIRALDEITREFSTSHS